MQEARPSERRPCRRAQPPRHAGSRSSGSRAGSSTRPSRSCSSRRSPVLLVVPHRLGRRVDIRDPNMSWSPAATSSRTRHRVINDPAVNFWTALWNSIFVGAHRASRWCSSRRSPAGRSRSCASAAATWLLVFVVATMAVPTQLGVVPLYILFADLGWTGSIGAIIIPALTSAFGVFWMTQYLRRPCPTSSSRPPASTGQLDVRTFWHVGCPRRAPPPRCSACSRSSRRGTNFFWPFIVLGPQNPTLPVALSLLQSNYFVDYSHRARRACCWRPSRCSSCSSSRAGSS